MSPRGEEREKAREAPPSRLPDTQPQSYPGQHYDFTLQCVFEMQKSVGKLTEAVEGLKDETKQQRGKLDDIGKDVHAAKVVLRIVGGFVAAFLVFIGWVIYELVPALRDILHKP